MSTPNAPDTGVVSLASLPEDILFLIVKDLSAWDVYNCQRVSKACHQVFTNTHFVREVLKNYAGSRDIKLLLELGDHARDLDWRRACALIGTRYHNLESGTARKIDRYTLKPSEPYDHWYPVAQWDYHESQPGGRLYRKFDQTQPATRRDRPYLFQATLWSYDDGLVVYAPEIKDDTYKSQDSGSMLSIIDLETGTTTSLDFSTDARIIRNVNLRNRVLVIEWAERQPFHALNDSEEVHRHFATCFDIARVEDGVCKVTFRNEWKLHFLGLPLNTQDRFFSVHNGQHYAVYFWQPNRSMYTGDEDMPIESLFIWDISVTSTYFPSRDPAGRRRPPESERPHPIAVFSFRDLDFLGVRQHSNVSLMSMHLDSETWSLAVRENVCVAGQGYFDPAERLMCATTTTFLFRGAGPARCQIWHGDLPPYRGHCSMESVDVEEIEKWFLPVMDVYDETADVRFSLVETVFTGLSSENRIMVRIKSKDQWSTLDDTLTAEIVETGRIAGDERWLVGQNALNQLVVLKF